MGKINYDAVREMVLIDVLSDVNAKKNELADLIDETASYSGLEGDVDPLTEVGYEPAFVETIRHLLDTIDIKDSEIDALKAKNRCLEDELSALVDPSTGDKYAR